MNIIEVLVAVAGNMKYIVKQKQLLQPEQAGLVD
tara:strand:+ start:266 stop:367 length:102 start_codon:yes stop_codon:yes gene_type:complete